MSQRAIILKPFLAQAAHEGRKTVTRRLGDRYARWSPGDLLWVKETWATVHFGDTLAPRKLPRATPIYYSGASPFVGNFGLGDHLVRPSIFMPKWACRTWLDIVSIRQEPLHDITPEDAIAEGIECRNGAYKDYLRPGWGFSDPIESFKTLWIHLNSVISWYDNPPVWRIEVKKVTTPCPS